MALELALDFTMEDELVAEFAVQKKLNTRNHQWNSSSRIGSLRTAAAHQQVEHAVVEWYLVLLNMQP